MDSMSLLRWLIVVGVFYALTIIPVARIMRRAGRSSYWSILALFPLVSFIGLWVFAFTRRPALDGPSVSQPNSGGGTPDHDLSPHAWPADSDDRGDHVGDSRRADS